MLSMYSGTLESEWAYMLLAVWPRSLFWANSQAEVSTDFETRMGGARLGGKFEADSKKSLFEGKDLCAASEFGKHYIT
jgi:hypothetical protein